MGFINKHYNEISLIIGALSLFFSIFTFAVSSSIKKQVRKFSFQSNVKNDIVHLNRYHEILCCSSDRLTDIPFLTQKQIENIKTGDSVQIRAFHIETLSKAKSELSYLGSRYKKTLDKKTKDKIQSAAGVINGTIYNYHERDLVRCADKIKEIIGELERLQEE